MDQIEVEKLRRVECREQEETRRSRDSKLWSKRWGPGDFLNFDFGLFDFSRLSPLLFTMVTQNPPAKRTKREEYRRNVQAQQESTDGSVIMMPQKKFFRQRAHANPFSDHRLE